MKKNLFFAALALTALAGCTSDEFVGDQSLQNGNDSGVIQFTSSTPNITRAEQTGATAAADLGYKFQVYATKTIAGTPDVISNVFAQNPIGTPDANGNHTPYWVWYQTSTGGTTTSNTKDWEYVGSNGTAYGTNDVTNSIDYRVTLSADQTIKYWDYSAKQYDFVAYSATVQDGTTPYSISNYGTNGFTISATAAELAGLYIANKITLLGTDANTAPTFPATTYNKIGDIVKFTFRSSSAKVRLGIYETIPGYDVKDVVFHYTNGTDQRDDDEAYLDGQFVGSSSGNATYAITYNETGIPVLAIQQPQSGSYNTTFYNFGSFDSSTKIGETSTTPTWASANVSTNNYIPVFPNTADNNNIAPMLLKVDYTLHNGTTGEEINVTGAKAAVPAAFMEWQANHAYTYLFKISPNTNGSTGQNVVGLYPITFDAVTIAAEDASQGTITTVTTPSITTYQEGSVTDAGIEYKSGKAITATVTTPVAITGSPSYAAGDVLPIQSTTNNQVGYVQVFYLGTTAKTEADLQITPPTTNVQTVSVTSNVLSFTPTTSDISGGSGTIGYYAIQYLTATSPSNVYTYKVIAVKKAS